MKTSRQRKKTTRTAVQEKGGISFLCVLLVIVAAVLLVHCYILTVYYGSAQRECQRMLIASLYVLARARFEKHPPRDNKRKYTSGGSLSLTVLRLLFLTGASLSLLGPWYLIFWRGNYATLTLLAPHMLVYAVQLLFETWSSSSSVNLPLVDRLVIIIAAISYRLILAYEWISEAPSLSVDSDAVLYLGYANFAFWFAILQLILISFAPKYFPKSNLPQSNQVTPRVRKNRRVSWSPGTGSQT